MMNDMVYFRQKEFVEIDLKIVNVCKKKWKSHILEKYKVVNLKSWLDSLRQKIKIKHRMNCTNPRHLFIFKLDQTLKLNIQTVFIYVL
jgi:hypothetical protein